MAREQRDVQQKRDHLKLGRTSILLQQETPRRGAKHRRNHVMSWQGNFQRGKRVPRVFTSGMKRNVVFVLNRNRTKYAGCRVTLGPKEKYGGQNQRDHSERSEGIRSGAPAASARHLAGLHGLARSLPFVDDAITV